MTFLQWVLENLQHKTSHLGSLNYLSCQSSLLSLFSLPKVSMLSLRTNLMHKKKQHENMLLFAILKIQYINGALFIFKRIALYILCLKFQHLWTDTLVQMQWLRWHGVCGFLGTHQFCNSGFRNPLISERRHWYLATFHWKQAKIWAGTLEQHFGTHLFEFLTEPLQMPLLMLLLNSNRQVFLAQQQPSFWSMQNFMVVFYIHVCYECYDVVLLKTKQVCARSAINGVYHLKAASFIGFLGQKKGGSKR